MIHFDLDKIKNNIEKLENETIQEGFWNDSKNSSIVLQQLKTFKEKYNKYNKLESDATNLLELNDILLLDLDSELANDLLKDTTILQSDLETFEIETLLSDKFDINNAIITLHPGAGGTESQDWVEMLYRMYSRWATKHGFTIKELDYLEGEEAGIKSVTALISGE